MRLSIRAIGRMKSGPESEMFDRFLGRARATGRTVGISDVTLREFAESRAANAAQRRDEEAGLLLGSLPGDCRLVALDEKGKDESSTAIAAMIGARLADATPEIAFAIGGPDGHGSELLRRASLVLRFGHATWPHRLVRIMLAEQVYRATTILSGHPYHRE